MSYPITLFIFKKLGNLIKYFKMKQTIDGETKYQISNLISDTLNFGCILPKKSNRFLLQTLWHYIYDANP